jgi:hypothetical protein
MDDKLGVEIIGEYLISLGMEIWITNERREKLELKAQDRLEIHQVITEPEKYKTIVEDNMNVFLAVVSKFHDVDKKPLMENIQHILEYDCKLLSGIDGEEYTVDDVMSIYASSESTLLTIAIIIAAIIVGNVKYENLDE